MSRKVLMAIGAHSDDIEFNAGGTLFKYLEKGYEVVYILATNNMSGSWGSLDEKGKRVYKTVPWHEIMPQRKIEAAAGAAAFGTTAIHLDHPQRHYINDDLERIDLAYGVPRPGCVPENTPTILMAHEKPAARKQLAELIVQYEPEAILTHDLFQNDMEHIGTSLLVAKTVRECKFPGMLLLWPCADETPYGNICTVGRQTYIDISDFYSKKMEAMKLHKSQLPSIDHIRFRPWEEGLDCEHVEAFAVCCEGEGGGEFSQEIREHWQRS